MRTVLLFGTALHTMQSPHTTQDPLMDKDDVIVLQLHEFSDPCPEHEEISASAFMLLSLYCKGVFSRVTCPSFV